MKEERIIRDCPICEEEHEIIIRTTLEETDYKGEMVQYEETVYICDRTGEEFTPIKVMSRNLLNIEEAYIKKMNSNSVDEERVTYDCPLCEQEHEIIIKKGLRKGLVKGEVVEFEGTYYFCENTREEFVPAEIMDKNLLMRREAYIKSKNS